MSPSNLPAISLNVYADGEYVITAQDRTSGAILAAASSYDCETATLRIDLQLIELGIDLYRSETY
jgi:hypothetical protein